MEPLSLWFIVFGLTYLLLSTLMQRNSRRLKRLAGIAESGGAERRDDASSERYFNWANGFGRTLSLALIWALLLILVGVLGVAIVYTIPSNVVIFLFLVFQAYFIYKCLDPTEALFLSHFILNERAERLGRLDIERIRWAEGELLWGRWAFLLMGTATFLLSFATTQLTLSVEALVAAYVWFVYAVSGSVTPTSPLLSVLVVALVTFAGIFLLVWVGTRIVDTVGRLRRR